MAADDAVMIRLTRRPFRLYVHGHRVHHGLLGLVWALSDWHDWRQWVPDLLRREP